MHATLPVVFAEDVAVGTTTLVNFAGRTSPEVRFRPLLRGHPWLTVLGWRPRLLVPGRVT